MVLRSGQLANGFGRPMTHFLCTPGLTLADCASLRLTLLAQSLNTLRIPLLAAQQLQVLFTPSLTAADRAALLLGAHNKAGEHLSRALKFVVARAGEGLVWCVWLVA